MKRALLPAGETPIYRMFDRDRRSRKKISATIYQAYTNATLLQQEPKKFNSSTTTEARLPGEGIKT
jgi:hypothetical protein